MKAFIHLAFYIILKGTPQGHFRKIEMLFCFIKNASHLQTRIYFGTEIIKLSNSDILSMGSSLLVVIWVMISRLLRSCQPFASY